MATDTKEIRLSDTQRIHIEDLIKEKREIRVEPIPDITTLDVLFRNDFRENGPFVVKFDLEGIPSSIYKRDGPSKAGPYQKSTLKELSSYQARMRQERNEQVAEFKRSRGQKS